MDLITQPYDKIDRSLQKKYYEKSAFNYCRLTLPLENSKYDTSKQRIQEWLSEDVLSKDDEPAVFVSRQKFKLQGRNCSRTGLIAALRLYSYGEKTVFPHEVTYKEPKADRLNMLRAVQKDLEPVFLIYSDPENITIAFFAEITQTKPAIEVEDSFGVKHALWRVTDPQKLETVRKAMPTDMKAPSLIETKDVKMENGHRIQRSIFTCVTWFQFKMKGLLFCPLTDC